MSQIYCWCEIIIDLPILFLSIVNLFNYFLLILFILAIVQWIFLRLCELSWTYGCSFSLQYEKAKVQLQKRLVLGNQSLVSILNIQMSTIYSNMPSFIFFQVFYGPVSQGVIWEHLSPTSIFCWATHLFQLNQAFRYFKYNIIIHILIIVSYLPQWWLGLLNRYLFFCLRHIFITKNHIKVEVISLIS